MAVVKKRPGYYLIDYYIEGTRKREYGGKTKQDAEYKLSKRRSEIYEGKLNLQALNGKTPFSDFAGDYLKMSKGYKRSYRRDEVVIAHLKAFLGNKPLGRINALDIENYRRERLNEVKKLTVNRETIVMRHLLNTAVRLGKILHNPMQNIKQFKVEETNLRVISKEEERLLLENSCEHLKPIIITALNTGMRLGELLSLKWDNVNVERGIITVVGTKSGKNRTIPINNKLKNTLSCVINYGADNRVFCDNKGNPIASIKTAFNKAVKRAKIRRCRFHDLRHTFASRIVEKGVNIVTVKELLGHANINTTMRYSHPAPEYKVQAVEALND